MTPYVRGPHFTYRVVANRLGAAVVTGAYPADISFPTEADLCRQYGASRSVVREAIKMLTAKGLLGSRPRRGTWVQPEETWNLLDPDVLEWLLERQFSAALLIEFTELRLAVEPGAATLAARVAGAAEKTAIRSAIERMKAADRGEDDPLNANIAFHVAVLRASCNRFFEQLIGFSEAALRLSNRMANRHQSERLANLADHKKVADAIIAGRSAAAGEGMRKLIQVTLDLIGRREVLRGSRRKPGNATR
jgi:DNA-binding FadR family transcriptional regulator